MDLVKQVWLSISANRSLLLKRVINPVCLVKKINRSFQLKWRHTFSSIFSVLDLTFFASFEVLSNKTFFQFLCLSKFQSSWASKCSNDHHPQRPKHATFKMSCLSVETLYPLENIVTHLGDSFAPISVSGTKESKENFSRVTQCNCCWPRDMLRVLKALFPSSTVSDWQKKSFGV